MKYDLIVIGAGPAGLMTAGRAGELGARVLLLEKNPSPGLKLLITGKGRCNISNNTFESREMIKQYGQNGAFLFSALHQFSVAETVDFFESRGLKTKVERGNRIFPVSDKSQDVLATLLKYCQDNNVEIRTNVSVKEIKKESHKISSIVLHGDTELSAYKYCIATGGKSYPATGSSGDAYIWLEGLGHSIVRPRPALTPINCQESFLEKLEGLSLKNIEISLWENDKKQASEFGEAIFTASGMSGPVILNLSNHIANRNSSYELQVDWKPALDREILDKRIQNDFRKFNNKQFKNSLDELLPKSAIPVFLELLKVDINKQVNLVTREERNRLIDLLKEFKLKVSWVHGFEKAIITRGGVNVKEVDPKTMQSKIIDNLYLAGEVLDVDGPTGGYNLQICWSSGYVAGSNIGQNIE